MSKCSKPFIDPVTYGWVFMVFNKNYRNRFEVRKHFSNPLNSSSSHKILLNHKINILWFRRILWLSFVKFILIRNLVSEVWCITWLELSYLCAWDCSPLRKIFRWRFNCSLFYFFMVNVHIANMLITGLSESLFIFGFEEKVLLFQWDQKAIEIKGR